MKHDSIPLNSYSEKLLSAITSWGNKSSGTEELFTRTLWEDEDYINQNIDLRQIINQEVPVFDRSIYSNDKLIIQILESKPSTWHDAFINSYQDTLMNLIRSKAPDKKIRRLLIFLLKTRVGVNDDFLNGLTNFNIDEVLLMELEILNIIRCQETKNTPGLAKWKNIIEKRLKGDYLRTNPIKKLCQLPLLSTLWEHSKPKDLIYKYIYFDLNGFIPENSPRLYAHLFLHFRISIMKLCDENRMEELSSIVQNFDGWTQDLFEATIQSPLFKNCSEKLEEFNKQEQEHTIEIMKQGAGEKLNNLFN